MYELHFGWAQTLVPQYTIRYHIDMQCCPQPHHHVSNKLLLFALYSAGMMFDHHSIIIIGSLQSLDGWSVVGQRRRRRAGRCLRSPARINFSHLHVVWLIPYFCSQSFSTSIFQSGQTTVVVVVLFSATDKQQLDLSLNNNINNNPSPPAQSSVV